MPSKLEPTLMPLMTHVSTVTDHFPNNREATIAELSKYLATDTVCIRADASERDLYQRQCEVWDPLVEWMHSNFNCKIGVTSAIGKPKHADDALANIIAHLHTLTDFQLQGLFAATTVCKSLTIGLGVIHNHISISRAIAAARVEEEHQIDLWGMVEGGHDVDRAHIAVQVAGARVLTQLEAATDA